MNSSCDFPSIRVISFVISLHLISVIHLQRSLKKFLPQIQTRRKQAPVMITTIFSILERSTDSGNLYDEVAYKSHRSHTSLFQG
jgi:hypothetical protein